MPIGESQKHRFQHAWKATLSLGFFVVLALFAWWQLPSATSVKAAQAPAIITYQGKLLVNSQSATTTQSMILTLYVDPTSGLSVYTASGTVGTPLALSVTPVNGIFTVNLGDTGTNPIDPTIFRDNGSLYLQVTIGGQILSPRKQITTAPYAFNAKYLDGVGSTSTPQAAVYIPLSDDVGNFNFNHVTSTGVVVNGSLDVSGTTTLATTTLGFLSFTSATGTNIALTRLNPGTGDAGTIIIGASQGTGAITIGNSSFAQTLNLGIGTSSTVNIATGVGTTTVNIGTNGATGTINIGSSGVQTIVQGGLSVTGSGATTTNLYVSGGSTFSGATLFSGATFTSITTTNLYASRTSTLYSIVLPSGSSYPTLTFAGDTNTGIYSGVSTTIQFMAGGNSRMAIDSSTIYLQAPVTAYGDVTTLSNLNAYGNASVTGTFRVTGDVYFTPSGVSRMVIDSSTIYLQAPVTAYGDINSLANLNVYSNVNVTGTLRVLDTTTLATTTIGQGGLSVTGLGVTTTNLYVSGPTSFADGITFSSIASSSVLFTGNGGVVRGNSTTISTNGTRVGIGTSNPLAKLDVVGDTYIRGGSLYLDTFAPYTGTSLIIANSTVPTYLSGSGVFGINTTSPIAQLSARAAAGNIPFEVASSTNASLMRVDKNGNVVIGVASGVPTNAAKLVVRGDGGDVYAIENAAGSRLLTLAETGAATYSGTIRINGGQIISGSTSDALLYTLTAGTSWMSIANVSTSVGFVVAGPTTGNIIRDYLQVRTAWTGAQVGDIMALNQYGSLGINTSSPIAKLSIVATSSSYPLEVASSSMASMFRIDRNGNVGVGTSSPVAQFSIEGEAGTDGIRYSSTSPIFVARPNGNVGIGTASPSEMLEINGRTKLGNITYAGLAGTYVNDGNLPIQMNAAAGGEANLGVNKGGGYGFLLGFKNTQVGYPGLGPFGYMRMVSTDAFAIMMNNTQNSTVWNKNLDVGFGGDISNSSTFAGAKLVVRGTGDVGIGTSTPQSQLVVVVSSTNGVALSAYDNANNLIFSAASSSVNVLDATTYVQTAYTGVANAIDIGAQGGKAGVLRINGSGIISFLDANGNVNGQLDAGGYVTTNGGITSTFASIIKLGSSVNALDGLFTVSQSGNVSATGTLKVFGQTNLGLLNVAATSTLATTTVSGYLGVGTTAPIAQLHVAGFVPNAAVDTVSTTPSPKSIAIQGRYAYVVASSSPVNGVLAVYNISSTTPTLVSYTTSTSINDPHKIIVSGRYAYVDSFDSAVGKIAIFDISNPAAPVLTGSVLFPGGIKQPVGMALQGKYIYAVASSSAGNGAALAVFDVSKPAAPIQVGSSVVVSDGVTNLAVNGSFAYVLTSTTLETYNIENPANMTQVGGFSGVSGPNGTNIAVQGVFAYILDNTTATTAELRIINISDPASPQFISSTDVAVNSLGNPYGLVVQGRYAYVTARAASRVEIIDVSNVSLPSRLGTFYGGSDTIDVAVNGRYLYSLGRLDNTLNVFDLGGAYIQQLEVGGLEGGSLTLRNNLSAVDGSFMGSLNVGQSLGVSGDVGVSGTSTLNGKVMIGTSSPDLQLTIGNGGGILAVGTYGAGETLTTVNAGTRMIWYPRAGSFRAGGVGDASWDATNTAAYSFAGGYGSLVNGQYGAAFGYQNQVTNTYAFAAGAVNNAGGYGSTAFGYANKAQGDYSFAAGYNNLASVGYATALGSSNNATNTYAFASGYLNNAGGYGSTALGIVNKAQGDYSFAAGYNNLSSAIYTSSLGSDNQATSSYAFAAGSGNNSGGVASAALGYVNKAQGDYSLAAGYNNLTTAAGATALGYLNQSTNTYAFAGGYGNTVGGSGGVGLGYANNVQGAYASALGYTNSAFGAYSHAAGSGNTASGTYAIALGVNNIAGMDAAFAAGYGNNANSLYSTALGRAMTINGTGSVGIGLNGSAYTVNQASSMAVMGGNVGIGTTTPQATLHVAGGSLLVDYPTPVKVGNSTSTAALYDVKVQSGLAYVMTLQGLEVYNITDPRQPLMLGTSFDAINSPDRGTLLNHRMAVAGNYLYAPGGWGGKELITMDISNPVAPTTTATSTGGSVFAGSVAVSGKFALESTYGNFKLYDISDPARINTLAVFTTGSPTQGVFISGHYGYGVGQDMFYVFNIASSSLTILGQVQLATTWFTDGVYVSGGYAYVGDYNNGFRIIDISNPTAPRIVSTLTAGLSQPMQVQVAGRYAYVTDGSSLRVIDITSSTAPFVVTSYSAGSTINGLEVVGKYAYLATAGGMQIVSLGGIDAAVATIDSLNVSNLTVWNDVNLGNNLYVKGGLNVGLNGFLNEGTTDLSGTVTIAPHGTGGITSTFAGLRIGSGWSNDIIFENRTSSILIPTSSTWTVRRSGSSTSELFSIRDLAAAFGSAMTGGAFISRNAYAAEEYNMYRAGNCTVSTSQARGDLGVPGTACTAGNGWITLSTSTNAPGTACTAASRLAIQNGIERITAASPAGSPGIYSCGESPGTASSNVQQTNFKAANLPVMIMKVLPSNVTTGAVFAGLTDATSSFTNFPTNGIYFTNCNSTGATFGCGPTSTSWVATMKSSVTGIVTTSTCPGAISTSQYAYLRIEVRAGTTNVHFFVDNDVSDGITELECGTGMAATAPTAAMAPWMVAQTGAPNISFTFDIDYWRIWQDDSADPVDPNGPVLLAASSTPLIADVLGPLPDFTLNNWLAFTNTSTVSSISFATGSVFTSNVVSGLGSQPFVFNAAGFTSTTNLSIFTLQSGGQSVLNMLSNGSILTNGLVQAGQFMTGTTTLDLAETYPVDPTCKQIGNCPEPGDVVCLVAGQVATVEKCSTADSELAIGVIATKPGFILGDANDPNQRTIALAGRVPVKVSLAKGLIKVGDRLTTSNLPGVVEKATANGPTIGIALEDYSDATVKPTLLVFVKMGWWSSLAFEGPTVPSTSTLTLANLAVAVFDILKNVGLTIENGIVNASQFVADKITGSEIDTQRLCVDGVCVSKDQFKDLLDKNNIFASSSSSTVAVATSTTSVSSTPLVDTTTSAPLVDASSTPVVADSTTTTTVAVVDSTTTATTTAVVDSTAVTTTTTDTTLIATPVDPTLAPAPTDPPPADPAPAPAPTDPPPVDSTTVVAP